MKNLPLLPILVLAVSITIPLVSATPLDLRLEDGTVRLEWSGPGVLESAPTPMGGWSFLPQHVTSVTRPATNDAEFFRVLLPTFRMNDTGQTNCYDTTGALIAPPAAGLALHGQDAQHSTSAMRFVDNGDGTISDLNTGLMWQQVLGAKVSWTNAVADAASFHLAGFSDWRLPSIKELYSLINFRGSSAQTAAASIPYIDTNYFGFDYGNTNAGERLIDVQEWSATRYVGTTMNGDPTAFGVNFADGRIKGYPISVGTSITRLFARYVRGPTNYAANHFVDNQDGTITDLASGLMWMREDSGFSMSWQDALHYAETNTTAGYEDWRLPDAKELQGIVDYTRAPLVTGTAAIDTNYFDVTSTESYFWTSTTHLEGSPVTKGQWAVYVCFGRAMGYMQQPPNSGNYVLLDVHGAGAQRGDPKDGDPADYPHGHGPQGDDVRIYNYVRCVRGGLNAEP